MPEIVDKAAVTAAATAAATALAGQPAPAKAETPTATEPAPTPAAPGTPPASPTTAAPASPTTPPTGGPSPVDVARLPELVKAAIERGEVKPESFQFLDQKWEPAYTKRVNRLNSNVSKALESTGFKLPEGTSVSDLIYKDDGKGFMEMLQTLMQQSVKPLTDKLSEAELDEKLRGEVREAAKNFPHVKSHLVPALQAIDQHDALKELATINDGQFLQLALAGVASDLELGRQIALVAEKDATIKKLTALLENGTQSTRTAPGAPPPEPKPQVEKMSGFRDVGAIRRVAERIQQELAGKVN